LANLFYSKNDFFFFTYLWHLPDCVLHIVYLGDSNRNEWTGHRQSFVEMRRQWIDAENVSTDVSYLES